MSITLSTYRMERYLNQFQLSPTYDPNDPASEPYVRDEEGFALANRIPGTGTTQYYDAEERAFQYIGKLTWSPNADNSLELSVYGTPTESGGDGRFGIDPQQGAVEVANSNSNNLIIGPLSTPAHNYVSSATDLPRQMEPRPSTRSARSST
jgi:hypothetical protein